MEHRTINKTINKAPVYVINLARSPNRLEYMTTQLSQHAMSFERIEAVDGVKINVKTLQSCQQQSKKSWLHYATLSAGEIGCAMSWHKAWQTVAEHHAKACVVLEDDIKIGDNFQHTIASLFEGANENIIIDLSGKKGSIEKERKTINGITLIRYQTPPLKTQGAIYGKQAVQKFLCHIKNFTAPVDTLQQMIWQHGVQTWSLETGCLSHQDSTVGGSTISAGKKKLSTKIKNELTRPVWRSGIVIRNLIDEIIRKYRST